MWRVLEQEGIVVPDALDPDEEFVDLDFTDISSRSVGSQHSRWCVRHAHGLYVLGRKKARLKQKERRLRIEKAKFRIRNSGNHKTKYLLEDAMTLDKEIAVLENQITKLEVECEILDAAVKGFESYRAAASREMSRRDSERVARD